MDFILNAVMLGIGLAMDAFSVSLANGLYEPDMSRKRMACISGTFSLFQFLMPMIGWLCIHTLVSLFHTLQGLIPWAALVALLFIGGQMIFEGLNQKPEEKTERKKLGAGDLLIQGIATSIDALSVGFAISEYGAAEALLASGIIGAVTFVICWIGLLIGRKAGTRMSGSASILGGVILILIGIRIFFGF